MSFKVATKAQRHKAGEVNLETSCLSGKLKTIKKA